MEAGRFPGRGKNSPAFAESALVGSEVFAINSADVALGPGCVVGLQSGFNRFNVHWFFWFVVFAAGVSTTSIHLLQVATHRQRVF